MTPAGTRVTWFVLGVCVGIVLAVVGMAGIAEAASRTAPDTIRAHSGAPLSGVMMVTDSGVVATPSGPELSGGAPPLPAVSLEASEPIATVPATAVSGLTGSPIGHQYVGVIAYADPSHGPRYLATPEKRGTLVTVCGPLGCVTRTTTDAGPDLSMQRAGRIADVSAVDFLAICGPLSMGLCDGTVTVGGDTLPATETKP